MSSETGGGLAELKVVMEKRKAREKTDTREGDQRTKSQELSPPVVKWQFLVVVLKKMRKYVS